MLISSIQTATNYTFSPINQRILNITQTVEWKEKTMLAGLIISVCCAVITFFTQTVFICSAFAALSCVCSLGALFIRHYESLKKMRECVEDLERQNQKALQNNDTTLQRIKELNHLHQQISCSHDQLADVLKSYSNLQVKTAQTSVQLSNLRTEYTLKNTLLQETRQELSAVSSELPKIRSDLQTETPIERPKKSKKNFTQGTRERRKSTP